MNEKNVFYNAKWIVACKVAQSLLQLIIGMLCARYLGPSNYGLINYAAAITAFAVPVMKLGFDATLVRELVQAPEQDGRIMGTAILMNSLSALLCMGGIFAFVCVADRGDSVAIIVCVLYSICLLSTALEMMQYWFQYKLLSKYSSVVMLCTYVLISAYRIFLLVTSKSIYWFALTNALDYGIIGLALIVLFVSKGGRLSASLALGKEMFVRSRQFILASLMVVVFQSTGHIMLTMMISKSETGFYSAAITCATVVQFVYVAIIDSYRPLILSRKKDGDPEYENDISRLYAITTYLSLLQSCVFCIFAGTIVQLLYGEAYAPSASVLRILIWYNAFSFMGVVRNVWILAEQKQKYLWKINLIGAVTNVALNLLLIPMAGACGAALSSLLTQIFTNLILGFILKPLRKNNQLLLRGLHPRLLAEMLRSCKQLLQK